MLRVAICLFLASQAWAQERPCCSPDAWEGRLDHLGGGVFDGTLHFYARDDSLHYDYTNKRFALHTRGRTREGEEFDYKTIEDFNRKVAYRIDFKARHCTRTTLEGEMERDCTPSHMRYLGEYYYGAGTSRLTCRAWDGFIEHEGARIFTGVSRAVSDCILVSIGQVVYENDRYARADFFGLVDVTPGIRDPYAFEIPSFCQEADEPLDVMKNYKPYHIFKRLFTK